MQSFSVFIHSAVCLPTGPQPLSERVQGVRIWYFLFQFWVSSLLLKVVQQLLTSSFSSFRRFYLPCIFPSRTLCCKAVPMQDLTSAVSLLFFLLFVGYSFAPWLLVTLLHFSHDRSSWSSPSFCSTTFQNFPDISDPLSGVFMFQHHAEQCSKYRILLASSLNWSPICLWNHSSSFWMLLFPWQYST